MSEEYPLSDKISQMFLGSVRNLTDAELERVIDECNKMDNPWWITWALKDAIRDVAINEKQLRGEALK